MLVLEVKSLVKCFSLNIVKLMRFLWLSKISLKKYGHGFPNSLCFAAMFKKENENTFPCTLNRISISTTNTGPYLWGIPLFTFFVLFPYALHINLTNQPFRLTA